MADSESIKDEMTSGDAVWVRTMFGDRFFTRTSAGTAGTELRRRGRRPCVGLDLASAGMLGTAGTRLGWTSMVSRSLFTPSGFTTVCRSRYRRRPAMSLGRVRDGMIAAARN